MPTRDEAAEALYRAGEEYRSSWVSNFTGSSNVAIALHQFWAALDAYRDATPTPLPAEVARVLEAAWKVRGIVVFAGADTALGELIAAYDAYRSSQPEPLSARLARLGKGAVVSLGTGTKFRVVTNLADHQELVCEFVGVGEGLSLINYQHVTAIVSESP